MYSVHLRQKSARLERRECNRSHRVYSRLSQINWSARSDTGVRKKGVFSIIPEIRAARNGSRVGDNYVETDRMNAEAREGGDPHGGIAFRCPSRSPSVSSSRRARRRSSEANNVCHCEHAGATGQIDPAAVTYRLASEQHKNVITPVIGNGGARARWRARGRGGRVN